MFSLFWIVFIFTGITIGRDVHLHDHVTPVTERDVLLHDITTLVTTKGPDALPPTANAPEAPYLDIPHTETRSTTFLSQAHANAHLLLLGPIVAIVPLQARQALLKDSVSATAHPKEE